MKDRNEEALLVLARLHAHGDIHDSFVVSEYKEILAQVQIERQETRDAWTQLFTVKSNFRRLLLGVAIQFRCVSEVVSPQTDIHETDATQQHPDDRCQRNPILRADDLSEHRNRYLNDARAAVRKFGHRTYRRSPMRLVHRPPWSPRTVRLGKRFVWPDVRDRHNPHCDLPRGDEQSQREQSVCVDDVVVQPGVLFVSRPAVLGDPRRDVQQRDACEGNGDHFLCGVDIQLYEIFFILTSLL